MHYSYMAARQIQRIAVLTKSGTNPKGLKFQLPTGLSMIQGGNPPNPVH